VGNRSCLYVVEQTESGTVAVSAGQFKTGLSYSSAGSVSLLYANGSSCGTSSYSTSIVFRCRTGMRQGVSALWNGSGCCSMETSAAAVYVQYGAKIEISLCIVFWLHHHDGNVDAFHMLWQIVKFLFCGFPLWGRGTPFSPFFLLLLLPHLLLFLYFSFTFIGFTYFLFLSIPSLYTRIVPLCFQAGGHRKRPNLV